MGGVHRQMRRKVSPMMPHLLTIRGRARGAVRGRVGARARGRG